MTMQRSMRIITLTICLLLALAVYAAEALMQSQQQPPARHVRFIKFQSESLKGNLIGDPHERIVAVALPPSYFRDSKRRFPVVYLLHGLGRRENGHIETSHMFPDLFLEMRDGKLGEMILVAIDGTTVFGGSYYANSPTIGNFEDYIIKEIIPMIDTTFRTQAIAEWRAIGGFSMGGHGAIKIAMKHSDLFSQVGSLSGSPLSIRFRRPIYKRALQNHRKPSSMKEFMEEISYEKNWSLAAAYAKAAAFSPNPSKPPLYLDLPFETPGRDENDPAWLRWWDDDPLTLVTKYQNNLRSLDHIYFDHGDDETTLGSDDFDRELVRYGIGHTHYIFSGDHVDNLRDRYLRMLRFFGARWAYQ